MVPPDHPSRPHPPQTLFPVLPTLAGAEVGTHTYHPPVDDPQSVTPVLLEDLCPWNGLLFGEVHGVPDTQVPTDSAHRPATTGFLSDGPRPLTGPDSWFTWYQTRRPHNPRDTVRRPPGLRVGSGVTGLTHWDPFSLSENYGIKGAHILPSSLLLWAESPTGPPNLLSYESWSITDVGYRGSFSGRILFSGRPLPSRHSILRPPSTRPVWAPRVSVSEDG